MATFIFVLAVTLGKEMKNFVFKQQSKAYQGSKTFKSNTAKTNYASKLEDAIKQFNIIDNSMTGGLYGIVYYFHKRKTGTDADNISKPIWDCLKGILFDDNKQIKLRTAGLVDISRGDLNVIDFSAVRGEITAELVEAFSTLDHFVYIEVGALRNSMYKLNLEINGD